MVFTPIYSGLYDKKDDKEKIIEFYAAFFQKHKIDYFDYSSDSLSSDTLNFYNALHMNKVGVRRFNNMFIEALEKIL